MFDVLRVICRFDGSFIQHLDRREEREWGAMGWREWRGEAESEVRPVNIRITQRRFLCCSPSRTSPPQSCSQDFRKTRNSRLSVPNWKLSKKPNRFCLLYFSFKRSTVSSSHSLNDVVKRSEWNKPGGDTSNHFVYLCLPWKRSSLWILILYWSEPFCLRSLEHKPFAVPYDVSAQNFSAMIAAYPREQFCNRRELRIY